MNRNIVTSYQLTWEKEFPWVKRSKQRGYADCTLCNNAKPIFYESMGKAALSSHGKSKGHKMNENAKGNSESMTSYISPPGPSRTSPNLGTGTETSQQVAVTLSSAVLSSQPTPAPGPVTAPESRTAQFFGTFGTSKSKKQNFEELEKRRDAVTLAETVWCLHAVVSHSSLRKAEDGVLLFSRMFPDSEIAVNMKLHKDKIAYCASYGLAPYFKSLLKEEVKECKFFVVGYDESMNKVAQKQQMDIALRFWNSSTSRVVGRYYTSEFLEESKASNLLDSLKTGLFGLDLKAILQFSMDGPNVNLKLKRLFSQEMRNDPELPKLLEIGTCGLHVVHGAFKTGMNKTEWNLSSYFYARYYLFEKSPTRRGNFKNITESDEFPMKFCGHRWLENGPVVKKEQKILPNLKKYVESVEGTEDEPQSSNFRTVREALKDKLLPAKLAFFQSVADDLERFLREFQSEAPLAPFLHRKLVRLVRILMDRFVKPDVLKATPLEKIDVLKKKDESFVNVLPAKQIDLGILTRAALKKCQKLSDKDTLRFRNECRTCLMFLVSKLMEKSPLKYPLTKALACLDPVQVAAEGVEGSIEHLSSALDILLEANIFPGSVLEGAKREYRDLISEDRVMAKMKSYSEDVRLDDFWMSFLNDTRTPNLIQVVKCLLILSHGNASLERGFSINKDVVVENLTKDSLRAQRLIFDAVQDAGGVQNMEIPKKMILSMRGAHGRWKDALEKKKSLNLEKQKAAENKRKLSELAKELEAKKKKNYRKVGC